MRDQTSTYLKVNLIDWVCKTAKRVKVIDEWIEIWYDVYWKIGGTSDSSGSKVCPRSAAKTLWFLGRLRCSDRTYLDWSYQRIRSSKEISSQDVKNGIYALMAIDILDHHREGDLLTKDQVWERVREMYLKYFPNDTFPKSEQGEVTVAYKLWHLDQIKDQS